MFFCPCCFTALQLLQDFHNAIVINNWGMENQNFALLMGFTFHRNWLKNVVIFNSFYDMISDYWTKNFSYLWSTIPKEGKKMISFSVKSRLTLKSPTMKKWIEFVFRLKRYRHWKLLESHFWLPAACGGAALEANINVVGAMSFTQDCRFWIMVVLV